jgi:hypothetical protein
MGGGFSFVIRDKSGIGKIEMEWRYMCFLFLLRCDI